MIVRWEFTPDRVQIYPKLGPQTVAYPVFDTVQVDSLWAGRLVVPGTVTVVARYEGQDASDSAQIVIMPRGWATPSTEPAELGRLDIQLNDSTLGVDGTLGRNVDIASGQWVAKYNGVLPDPDTVLTGPNEGYIYYSTQAFRLNRGYQINRRLYSDGPAEVPIAGKMYNHWNATIEYPQQSKPNPGLSDLSEGVIAHELRGRNAGFGHQGTMEAAVMGDVCGNIGLRLERIAGSPVVVQGMAAAAVDHGQQFLGIATAHWKVRGNYENAPLVFLSSSGPLRVPISERTEPVPTAPDPFCKYEAILP
jgi:hypothetical protein